MFALASAMVAVTAVEAIAGFTAGAAGLIWGSAESDGFVAAVSIGALLASVLLAVAAVAAVRNWTRLHRPGRAVAWLGVAGFLVPMAGLSVYLSDEYRSWAYALVVPPIFVSWALSYLRSVLHERATCRSHPDLPPHIRAMLRHVPEPTPPTAAGAAAISAATESDEFRIEDCPHFVKLGDLRPRYQVQGVVFSVLYLLYWFGAVALAGQILINLGNAVHTAVETVSVALAVPFMLAMVVLSNKDLAARSKRVHKSSADVTVWNLLGYAATLGTAIWATRLGSPLPLVLAVLAFILATDAVNAATSLTYRSECRTNPELPPAIRAMLRSPAPNA